IGHPDIGMDAETVLFRRFNEGVAKKPIILVSGKNNLPVVAAQNDMLQLTGDDKAGKAGHGDWISDIEALEKHKIQNIVSDPFILQTRHAFR
ncbi:MAG: hypothetical protein ACU833_14605, partial [Gammaproteobacteria bacterium]